MKKTIKKVQHQQAYYRHLNSLVKLIRTADMGDITIHTDSKLM